MYPREVCTSTKKAASARSSRAAAPFEMVNRAPEILAAWGHSRMPSASPSSQCGFGAKSSLGFSPQVRTTTLSFSSLPSGTESWGTLGTTRSSFSMAASTCFSSSSEAFTWSERTRASARAASPAALSVRMSWPTRALASDWRFFSPSRDTFSSRRRPASSFTGRRVATAFSPRRPRRRSTPSKSWITDLRSSMERACSL